MKQIFARIVNDIIWDILKQLKTPLQNIRKKKKNMLKIWQIFIKTN